jgi:hypothetical protein
LFIHPLAPLVLFAIALAALLTSYAATGLWPSKSFEVVAAFGWSLLLAIWVVADARRRKLIPCFDFGFFCYVFMPVVVPCYCFWSRGWRGALTLATLVSLWVVPYVVATVVWLALDGQ